MSLHVLHVWWVRGHLGVPFLDQQRVDHHVIDVDVPQQPSVPVSLGYILLQAEADFVGTDRRARVKFSLDEK